MEKTREESSLTGERSQGDHESAESGTALNRREKPARITEIYIQLQRRNVPKIENNGRNASNVHFGTNASPEDNRPNIERVAMLRNLRAKRSHTGYGSESPKHSWARRSLRSLISR
ncbi:hypothetical protein SUGI_1252240 [Cryptomeria japonica]|uniref:Uncharacterized protein n=1 Tax=Cryptomeria japonica TaxID=3369 RepID=A0AAD3NQF1_CRYJA|nr:hypothetical protein SUGI_1252240 [Cryptomeria japonica]